MAKKAQPAAEADVATEQVAVLTDSSEESGAQVPAVTEPTAEASIETPKKARRPRAAKANSAEVTAPTFTPSTEATLAEVTEQVEAITQPLQGAVMDFTGTSDDDPRATQRRGNARLALARLPGQLAALKAEVEKTYGPESAESKLVEQALAETHEVLGGVDLFDIDPAQRAMARAAQVLEKNTDPRERATARQALRELREQLREAHDLTREYGFDPEVVEDLVETLEATMFTFGLTVEGDEEAKLAAADEAAQPTLVDCPYPTLAVKELPDDSQVLHLQPGASVVVRFFMGSGVSHEDGDGGLYRVQPAEAASDGGKQFRLTAETDVNLLVVAPVVAKQLADGQLQVTTAGTLAYLAGQADDRLQVVEAEEVKDRRVLAALGRLLGGNLDRHTFEVKDRRKVLTHEGETAVLVSQTGKVARVVICRLGQLARAKKDARGEDQGKAGAAATAEPKGSKSGSGILLGQFMPPETVERLQTMANGHTATQTASVTTQSAEPAQPTQTRPAPRPTQARPTAAPKTAPVMPTPQPAQPVAQATPKLETRPTQPTLVNKATESAPGIRLLAVPGEGRRLKTLQLDPGVKVLTDGFVSSLTEWAEVTGEVEGGLELTVTAPVVVTVGCHESGSWLRQNEVDVQQVLFACEPTETYLAPATRLELEVSNLVMDHLERIGEPVYETGVEDAFELMRYARVERDQHLLVYRTTRDGRPVNRVAVVTPSIVADARQECGIR